MDKQTSKHDLLPRPLRVLVFIALIVIALFAIRLIDRHVMARMTSPSNYDSQNENEQGAWGKQSEATVPRPVNL